MPIPSSIREAIPSDHIYRFLIHDRDSIFSNEVDQAVEAGRHYYCARKPWLMPPAE